MRSLSPPYPIRISKRTAKLQAKHTEESLGLYSEVVLNDSYGLLKIPSNESIANIADIGANVGAFSLFASVRFPDAAIQAYEPHPDAYTWLVKNSEARNIKTFNVAVSDRDGESTFVASEQSTLSYLSTDGNMTVRTISPIKIFEGQEIDFLKIDCEGGEYKILQDPQLLKRTRFLAMEFHLDEPEGITDFVSLITDSGHKVQKLSTSPHSGGLFGHLWSCRI